MDAFVKSFGTYRTIKKAAVLSSSPVLDSLEPENGSVTVLGTDIGRSDAGNWMILDGLVYQIQAVAPQSGQTTITLVSPLDAFARSLEFENGTGFTTVGDFVAQVLTQQWVNGQDPVYAMPYLQVSNLDTTPYTPPEVDGAGLWNLPDYVRLMRKCYQTTVLFADGGDVLQCTIRRKPSVSRQIAFDDGRSQLQSVDYAASGLAKLTVLQDIDTGNKDENGSAIKERQRSTWYLSDTGEVSQDEPARRASGSWGILSVQGDVDIQSKVVEEFSKSRADHKLVFWSSLDLEIQDICTFVISGELLTSYIAHKSKISTDSRYYYKSGELATTITEKLKGLLPK